MKIGIYGGTFDPPHKGHMLAAKAAMEALELDEILFIPASIPPHKDLSEDSASFLHRLQMVIRMADELGDKANVTDLEMMRKGASYTIDTLNVLQKDQPFAEWYLLMGTDMFFSFDKWHRVADIAKRVTLAPFFREDTDNKEAFVAQAEKLEDQFGVTVSYIWLPEVHPMHSSDIREKLKKQDDIVVEKIPRRVYGYILREGLYGTKKSLHHLPYEELRAVALSMVRAKRVRHIEGTAKTAAELAKRWAADEDKARRSAILHDCTKFFSKEEHLAVCKRYDIALDEYEEKYEKLLHAKSGSAIARHVFGEDEEVWRAIDCHTTGKADMTTLDKVLYLADYIEPNRTFEGVETLRRLANENLDRAIEQALKITLTELKGKNAPIHPNAQRALDQLKEVHE